MVWSAPESDVLSIGEVFQFEREWFHEAMDFVPCAANSPRGPIYAWWGTSKCAFRGPATNGDGSALVVSHARPPRAYAGERTESFLTTWYHWKPHLVSRYRFALIFHLKGA
jgi:hypothetical protein